MEPVAIDHTAYPAIVDEVFALVLLTATPTDMLKLRCTSRAVKARVDQVLFSHIILASSDIRSGGNPTILSRLAALWPWRVAQMTGLGAHVAHPSAPDQPIFSVPHDGPLQPSAARATRILDLQTTLPVYGDLPQLQMVRHCLPLEATTWSMGIKHTPAPRPPPADVYVAHTMLEAVPEGEGSWWRNRGVPIAEGARRVVVHVSWDPCERNNVLTPYASGIPNSVTEFVVVLHPSTLSPADAGNDVHETDLDHNAETRSSQRRFTGPFVASIAEFGAALGASTTIVGVEACTAWSLDLPHLAASTTGHDLVHAVQRHIHALYPPEAVQLLPKESWLATGHELEVTRLSRKMAVGLGPATPGSTLLHSKKFATP